MTQHTTETVAETSEQGEQKEGEANSSLPLLATDEGERKKEQVQFIISVSTGGFNSEVQHYLIDDMRPSVGDAVMVQSSKQHVEKCGFVATTRRPLYKEDPAKLGKVLRLATAEEVEEQEKLHEKSQHILAIAKAAVKRLKLKLHIGYTEYNKKENKALLFFNSDQRVDYRELVKELGWELNMRIDMIQVGARELAKYVGGCGVCGQSLCCSTFLHRFAPISVKMAKVQDLSLNPTKISGCCGRLMCCLEYEFEAYRGLKQSFPKQGARFKCDKGNCQVIKNDLFGDKISIYENDNQRVSEMSKEEYLPFFKEGTNHMLPIEQADLQSRQRSNPKTEKPQDESKKTGREKRESKPRQERPKLQKMYKSIDDLDIASGDGMLFKSQTSLQADRQGKEETEGNADASSSGTAEQRSTEGKNEERIAERSDRNNRKERNDAERDARSDRNNRPRRNRASGYRHQNRDGASNTPQAGGEQTSTQPGFEGDRENKKRRRRRRRRRPSGEGNAPRPDGGGNNASGDSSSSPPIAPKE